MIGQVFPTAYYLTISRGTFSKGLGLIDLQMSFVALLIAIPVRLGLSAALLTRFRSTTGTMT